MAGGKSELHMAGRWITPSQGDLEESATESSQPSNGFQTASEQSRIGHGIDEEEYS